MSRRRIAGKTRPPAPGPDVPVAGGLVGGHSVIPSSVGCPTASDNRVRVRPDSVVTSLESSMQWPYYNMCQAERVLEHPLTTLCNGLTQMTSTSSAFSGVAAECVAMNCICTALDHELRHGYPGNDTSCSSLEVNHPHYAWSIELDTDADTELAVLPNGPSCRFTNVLDFCSEKLKSQLAMRSPPYKWDTLWELVNTPGYVTTTAPCRVHGPGGCKATRTWLHSSGSPCIDFSTWGKGRKLSGPTAPALAVWCVLMLLVSPYIIVIENVVQFPLSLARELFSAKYSIDHVDLSAADDFGNCVRRNRRFVVMTLRTMVKLTRPLCSLPILFGRARDETKFTWRHLLTAKPAEIRAEYLWARNRKEVQALAQDNCDSAGEPGESAHSVATPQSASRFPTNSQMLAALIPSEKLRRQQFLSQHDTRNCVMSLGQDPLYTRAASTPTTLHTIVKNCHIMWIEEEEHDIFRFFTSRELLLGQGFPVTNTALQAMQPHATQVVNLCSFNSSRIGKGLPPRHRVEMTSQCGNTIYVPMIGAVLHFILFFCKTMSEDERKLALARQTVSDCAATNSCQDVLSVWRRKRASQTSLIELEALEGLASDSSVQSVQSMPHRHPAPSRTSVSDSDGVSVTSDYDVSTAGSIALSLSSSSVSAGALSDFSAALRRARART